MIVTPSKQITERDQDGRVVLMHGVYWHYKGDVDTNGEAHGRGTAENYNNQVYFGTWKHGKRHGIGRVLIILMTD